ncbi:uncharacterized membrane protein YcaP (DUF421 family) [Natranaerovirga hydrolytica]|uniref:Uncharacterized membrane protein YcaP (DUF421 family) n=1 Tax=Natranaerovirga hydrolytica TaxID=680378 RepID=A0A4R1ML12_9FIRM|nr:DUF421 domain-containing protein [Natranaerovirga hydrolytica]TCK93185.1 uncharacterized membrane protein YcaP (DUF421 family) [Natranaerovirga hydrolytica]
MAYLKITFRILTIMGMLLAMVLWTGRRKIGELPVFDFLTILIVGNVVGADIADPNIEHLPTAYAVVLLIGLQYVMSLYTIKNRKFGKKVTFDPILIIQDGRIIKSNLKKVKYSLENVLMFLREKGIFDIREVEYAIVEDSGNISVMKKSQFQPLTPDDMKMSIKYKGLTLPLIIDGKVCEDNLKKINLNKNWLKEELKKHQIKEFEEVFYVEINVDGKLAISRMVESSYVAKGFMMD